jgi:NAD(P)-dependent dehydrogenase (short-subunit alcohol dehydrogenase family)
MKTAVMRIGKVMNMGKSVFVTGGCYGTGNAIAERFAREGYNVFISGRDKEKADAAAKAISEKYGVYSKGYGTVSFEQDEVSEIFADIEKNGYSIDSLVLNAANLGIGQESLTVDIDDFMGVYKINVAWNFMMSREAAKQMKKAGGGSIVFITSNSALRVTENRCAYCSTKSAILAMSKSFAVDWGKYGIRSNCVLPGMIKTERWQNNVNNCKYYLANYTPIEDIADFSDIANAVWYFASDESKATTGAELVVDGGMLAQLTPNIERKLWKDEE